MRVNNKMKVAAVVACLVGICFLDTGNSNEKMTALVLANAEALASGEGSGYYCFGEGSVECRGYYVKAIIDNYSLK